MSQNLGRLERIALRDIWKTEDQDFTPWLAKEENLAVLGETLGMELELKAQEKHVGPFRADILCVDTDDASYVLVENQLEKTNHSHLGQLMTYAAGLHTVTIVWIAEKFTDEHQAAMNWLNEITDTKFRFFGLEIELWRIGNSLAAPKFNIVSKPNDWSRSIVKSVEQGDWTPAQKLYYGFWDYFSKYLVKDDPSSSPRAPFAQSWMIFGVGRTGTSLFGILKFVDNKIGVRFQTGGEKKEAFYDLLYSQKEEIEAELGFSLDWKRMDGKKYSQVSYLQDANLADNSQWEDYCGWIKIHLDKLDEVFRPRVKNLNVEDWESQPSED